MGAYRETESPLHWLLLIKINWHFFEFAAHTKRHEAAYAITGELWWASAKRITVVEVQH